MKNKDKIVKFRVNDTLLNLLKEEAKLRQMSMSSYINFRLNSSIKKSKILFDELINKFEKKEVEIRLLFTLSEINLLKEYAAVNEWSLAKEARYRIVSSIAKKPKFNREELKAIYTVRSAINVLGANINRLIRDSKPLTADNIIVCQNLIELINELKNKISYLEKCNHSNFKLKEVRE